MPRARARGSPPISLFLGITGLALVSSVALPAKRHDAVELAAAAAIAVLLLAVISVLRERKHSRQAERAIPFILFIVIALVRDGTGGSSSGCEPLVLLPVLSVALYEEATAWSIAAIACVGLSVLIPLIVVGSPDYTTGDWRRGLFLTALAAVLAFGVRRWRQTHEAALTDRLTGAPNRRLWDEQFPRLVALAKREDKALSVAMIDLDRFKNYNDSRGHQAGDRLLASAVNAWHKELREGDLLARYGGEEFAICLYDCGTEQARDVLDRVRRVTPDGQTCSVGIATLHQSEDGRHILARADAALYEAKRDRNRTVTSTAE